MVNTDLAVGRLQYFGAPDRSTGGYGIQQASEPTILPMVAIVRLWAFGPAQARGNTRGDG